MTKQEKAVFMVEELKKRGYSYKFIADRIGVNLSSLYTWKYKKNLSIMKALQIIDEIEKNFAEEVKTINEKIIS